MVLADSQPEVNLRETAHTSSYEGQEVEFIQIPRISVLEQPRNIFVGIEELAESIRENGLMSPVCVAKCDRTQAREYIELVNKIWKRKVPHALKDLRLVRQGGEKFYYIMIAGECRLRAHQYLKLSEIAAFVYEGLSAAKLVRLQITENVRKKKPPLGREAQAIVMLFNLDRLDNEKLTKTQYAKEIGISPEQLLIYQRIFLDLPDRITQAFQEGLISLGIAREFWLIWDQKRHDEKTRNAFAEREGGFEGWLSNEALDRVRKDNNRTIKGCHEYLRTEFWTLVDVQHGLVLECPEENWAEAVVKQTLTLLLANIGQIERILKLFKEGKFKLEESPFLSAPFRRYFRQFLLVNQEAEKQLEILTQADRGRLTTCVTNTLLLLDQLGGE